MFIPSSHYASKKRHTFWLRRLGRAAITVSLFAWLLAGSVAAAQSSHAHGNPKVVEVVALDGKLFAPEEIPSGWTTFRFRNLTPGIHFAILEKMPIVDGDQKTLADSQAEVVPVFQNLMDLIAGRPFSFPEAGLELPAWYGQVVFTGGPGLLSGGLTGETTVHLEPGTYVVECYVKSNGVFHSVHGMITQIVVTDEPSRAREPRSNITVTISSATGIDVAGRLRPGRNTIAVNFADQAVYSHFLGHDVHLVKIENDTDLNELTAWMNWSAPGEFNSPAPYTFLGGVQDMPAGSTGYFNVHLKRGIYAFIAEVPDPRGKDMLHISTSVGANPNHCAR